MNMPTYTYMRPVVSLTLVYTCAYLAQDNAMSRQFAHKTVPYTWR